MVGKFGLLRQKIHPIARLEELKGGKACNVLSIKRTEGKKNHQFLIANN